MPPRRKKRKIAANYSFLETDIAHWHKLKRRAIYSSLQKVNYGSLLAERKKRHESKFTTFCKSFKRKKQNGSTADFKHILKCLRHYVKYCAWTFCKRCRLLCRKKLLPRSLNQKGARHTAAKSCICYKQKYIVPRYKHLPKELIKLTKEEENHLRIFDIDIGPIKYAALGHRVKNGAFELRTRKNTVKDRIDAIADPVSKERLGVAYNYLVNSKFSSYSGYLPFQDKLPINSKIKFWTVYKDMTGIECALWPALYPYYKWCESTLAPRYSVLTSFRVKLLCDIISYNNNFELLQFQYDRWLYKTITGAVNSGKYRHCSPLKSLETKPFTAGYWRWQHRFLMDAVLQYGPPTLFITLSPYEWDFPSPIWMTEEESISGSIPTKRGANETLHIAHILEQVSRGLISGCNSSTWESHDYKHLLYAHRNGLPNNVQCCFYRFEYQQRRTIHLHMLVWLRSCTELNLKRFKACVPSDTAENAYFVTRLQQSDQPAPCLNVCEINEATPKKMFLRHTPSDKALNIRAFIDTVLYVLQSRMDVQCSDGKQALMRYVASYISKLSENAKLLRSIHSTAFQQVWPFLIDLFPGEPEMAMAFADTHISYCNLSRVKLVPPTVEYLEESAIYKKYLDRLAEVENLSCLEYCRQYTISKSVPTVAATKNLVGVHYKYIFNPRFFYEYTIVNTPFRNISDLQDPILNHLPKVLHEFSYLYHNHKDSILSYSFQEMLAHIGYKDVHIKEYIVLIKGYILLYNRFLTNPHSNISSDRAEYNAVNLNLEQQIIFNHVISKIEQRASNIFSERREEIADNSDSADSSDSSSENSADSDSEDEYSYNCQILVPSRVDLDSDDTSQVRPILIKGEPGTGKTFVIEKIVKHCLENQLSILFAYATAYQARETKNLYTSDNVHSDTVHSIFKIPIDGSPGKVNFELMKFDIVIIDEVGMVTNVNMKHVISSLKSLPIPPVLLLIGDPSQQQPLGTIDGKTTVVANIFTSSFLRICRTFKLYQQNRFQCDTLLQILRCHEMWLCL